METTGKVKNIDTNDHNQNYDLRVDKPYKKLNTDYFYLKIGGKSPNIEIKTIPVIHLGFARRVTEIY